MEELNNLIHSPIRLRTLAYLATVNQSEFRNLTRAAGASDADLSRQLRLLREAGLVDSRRTVKSGKRTTIVSLTKKGEAEFRRYRTALDHALSPEPLDDHGD